MDAKLELLSDDKLEKAEAGGREGKRTGKKISKPAKRDVSRKEYAFLERMAYIDYCHQVQTHILGM